MRLSFKIFTSASARILMWSGVSLGCLVSGSALGRPIEFSEPTNSNLTASVSTLGAKPADLPSVEDRVFRPHSFSARRDNTSYNMRPMGPSPGPVNLRRSNQPGAFDGDQNWMQLSPEKILMQQMERDALKLPGFETGNNSSAAWSSWDAYGLKNPGRKSAIKLEPAGRSPKSTRPDGASDVLNTTDPFAQYSGRRAFTDVATAPDLPATGSDLSLDALRERKQEADHMDEFKRTLNFQTPGLSPLLPAAVSQAPRGNAFISEVVNPPRSSAEAAMLKFAAPVAPVAPRAPLAPGDTSLTPAPYSPTKLKPVVVTAPRRSF